MFCLILNESNFLIFKLKQIKKLMEINNEDKENEETDKINFNTDKNDRIDKFEGGEFKKVPIKHSIEVFNIINNMNRASNEKMKKKIYKYSLFVIAIILFLFITKTYLLDGIIQILKDESNSTEKEKEKEKGKEKEKDLDKYKNETKMEDKDDDDDEDKIDYNYLNREKLLKYFNNETRDRDRERDEDFNDGEIFMLFQNATKIDINNFSSSQLRNPKKIELIEKLEISLELEFDKFVHLKIKDADNKRWEVPKKDVLNQQYLNDRIDNSVTLNKYTKVVDSQLFFLEILENKKIEEESDEIRRDATFYREYNNSEEFCFRLMNNDNKQFFYFNTSQNFLYSDTFINFESKLTSDDIFGFGERTHEFKLNEGIYTIWPQNIGTIYDDGKGGRNQYGHMPIGLHKTKYNNLWVGFVFLNTNAQDVQIIYDQNEKNSNSSEVSLVHKTIGGIVDYYIIVDSTPELVVRNIQFLLGVPPLPPFWSLGNHQCRNGYKSFEEFKNVYDNYKKYKIPIDAMWIGIEAMDNFEIFTLNKQFEKTSRFVKEEIHKDGGYFVPIIDLGLSYENENSKYVKLGNSLKIFINSNYTKKPLITKVWSGKTVFPDFFNPKVGKFWNRGLKDYYKLVNYDGIWLDMNEPSNLLKKSKSKCLGEIVNDTDCTSDKNKYNIEDLPYIPGYREKIQENLAIKSISENALVYGDLPLYDIKPLISFYESKYTYEYLEMDLKIRPFILSRSTTLGAGKYAFHWLGDNKSIYDDLKYSISGLFNFNIFGIPFSGADICGFEKNVSKDLCIRWYNLGIFYPFMRNDNSKKSKDQFPWSFEKNNKKEKYNSINIIKKNINLRYSLLRYLYSQLFLISLNEKSSLFKPIMFEFPNDESSYKDIESKVMFGEAFLICTFYNINEEDKLFELPDSNFNEYLSGKSIMNSGQENNEIKLSGNLDLLHIFMRGGYIIPYQNTFDKYILNSQKLRKEKINLIININDVKQSKGIIFFDNDEVNTIKEQKYYRVELFFISKRLVIKTNKNKLQEYKYNDHILGKIELWRASEIFEMENEENKNKTFSINIDYNDELEEKESNIEGIYDKENNKVIFQISQNNTKISLFDIDEILFN